MATSKTRTQPGPQPAIERRAAEARLRTLIAEYAPASARLIAAVRRSLRKRLPTAHEVVYEYRGFFVVSFTPTGRGHEGVLGIRADAEGVRLYFNRGCDLPDPAKLLRGSGKQALWLALDAAATLAQPEVASLIEAAIALNTVPFESQGRGSVVIRTELKKAGKPVERANASKRPKAAPVAAARTRRSR